jgi:hypothetical protein
VGGLILKWIFEKVLMMGTGISGLGYNLEKVSLINSMISLE